MLALSLAGCAADAPEGVAPVPAAADATLDGFIIPLLATATEQLSYAKSLSTHPAEKAAALNLLINRFPDDRQAVGEARLELAYLLLGRDFRLADPPACAAALSAYEAIAREFFDLPAVRAKADWYMAWIHMDLLGDTQRGMTLYAQLAEQHPEDRFSRIFPVPWLKLVFPNPDSQPYTADDEHRHSWAGLALLEIVRHTDDADQRRQAFDRLWLNHRHSLTTGYALKEILNHEPATLRMRAVVEEYVQGNTVNAALNQDLLIGLAPWTSPAAMHIP